MIFQCDVTKEKSKLKEANEYEMKRRRLSSRDKKGNTTTIINIRFKRNKSSMWMGFPAGVGYISNPPNIVYLSDLHLFYPSGYDYLMAHLSPDSRSRDRE
jgi:hypothetical protein